MRIQRALTAARLSTPPHHHCCRSPANFQGSALGTFGIKHISRSTAISHHRSHPSTMSQPFSSGTSLRAPSREEITKLFKNMETGDYASFFKRVSPNVDWTVMGTHPCAGRYRTLQDFQEKTLTRLGKIMKDPGLRLKVRNVIGGGEGQEWATVEMVVHAVCLNGFNFDNTYSWCCRFDDSGIIVQVRAYLDSWMVGQALVENEDGDPEYHRAPVPDF